MNRDLSTMVKLLGKPRKLPRFVADRARRVLAARRGGLVVDDYVATDESALRTPLFRHTDVDREHVNRCVDEIRRSDVLYDAHRELSVYRKWHPGPPTRCFALYVLVRHFEPRTLVETGSSTGSRRCTSSRR